MNIIHGALASIFIAFGNVTVLKKKTARNAD